MIRLGAYRVHQSLVQKPLSIEDFWPLWGDKKVEKSKFVIDKEMYEKIKQIHGIN